MQSCSSSPQKQLWRLVWSIWLKSWTFTLSLRTSTWRFCSAAPRTLDQTRSRWTQSLEQRKKSMCLAPTRRSIAPLELHKTGTPSMSHKLFKRWSRERICRAWNGLTLRSLMLAHRLIWIRKIWKSGWIYSLGWKTTSWLRFATGISACQPSGFSKSSSSMLSFRKEPLLSALKYSYERLAWFTSLTLMRTAKRIWESSWSFFMREARLVNSNHSLCASSSIRWSRSLLKRTKSSTRKAILSSLWTR